MLNSINVLECQNCGTVIKELDNAEAQQVAYEPYKFIVFCYTCGQQEYKKLEERN